MKICGYKFLFVAFVLCLGEYLATPTICSAFDKAFQSSSLDRLVGISTSVLHLKESRKALNKQTSSTIPMDLVSSGG